MFLYFVFIFIFGLCVGSFLNVVICRLETGEGIVKKRSHCPKCGHILRWYDLIPVVSFLWLRGRCRDCGKKISWQYPAVELATGLLFVATQYFVILSFSEGSIIDSSASLALGLRMTSYVDFFYYLFIVSSLIVVFVYDLRHYIIPDKVIFPAIIISFIYRLYEVLSSLFFGHAELVSASQKILKQVQDDGFMGWGNWQTFFYYFLAALGASLFFIVIIFITRGKGMGWGDVKLAFLMGLVLGWPQILLALFLAFLLGAVCGLALIALGKKTMRSQIPFGPFLVAGTLLALFWGQGIINSWLGILI